MTPSLVFPIHDNPSPSLCSLHASSFAYPGVQFLFSCLDGYASNQAINMPPAMTPTIDDQDNPERRLLSLGAT